MKAQVRTNHKKIVNDLIDMNTIKRQLRGVIDDVEYENRKLLEMFSYALYDIHAMYLDGGTYDELVEMLNSQCVQKNNTNAYAISKNERAIDSEVIDKVVRTMKSKNAELKDMIHFAISDTYYLYSLGYTINDIVELFNKAVEIKQTQTKGGPNV